jgi:hypothetical protein
MFFTGVASALGSESAATAKAERVDAVNFIVDEKWWLVDTDVRAMTGDGIEDQDTTFTLYLYLSAPIRQDLLT